MDYIKKPTILVTGGAGYIGSHIVWALRDANPLQRIIVVDNLSNGHRKLLPYGVTLYEYDIHNHDRLVRLMRRENVTDVIHCAAFVSPEESVFNPQRYFHNNTEGTKSLWSACKTSGTVERFLFSSTAAVYESRSGRVVANEESSLYPMNPYAESKLMSEWILQDDPSFQIRVGILRYFNVAGNDPQGRTGLITDDPVHLIKRAAMVATGKLPRLHVFGNDYDTEDGTCLRDYIHVSDLALAHLTVLKHLHGETRFDIVNVGYGRGYSVLETIKTVEEVSGLPLPHVLDARRKGDPICVIADVSKIRSIGFTPQYNDLHAIIRDAIAWESNPLMTDDNEASIWDDDNDPFVVTATIPRAIALRHL